MSVEEHAVSSPEQAANVAAEPAPTQAEVVVEPVAPEAEKPAQDLSTLFAEKKRAEREYQQQKRQWEQSRQTWETERDNALRSDPLGALQKAGISLEDLASMIIDGPPSSPQEKKSLAGLDPEVMKDIDELRQIKSELQAQKEEQVLAAFRKEVFDIVESDPETFELLLGSGQGRDLYWNAVVNYYQETGEAPDYKELATLVENSLLEDGKRLLSLKKFKPAEPPPVEVSAPKPDSASKTLSNRLVPDQFATKDRIQVKRTNSSAPTARSNYSRVMEEQVQNVLAKFT